MPNQIERDVYVLEDGIENPISYVRATNAIPIVFHFRDYEIPDGATAQVFVNKPSGLAVYNSATISGNSVIVDTTMQMFAELGTSEMQIQISKDEDSLVTFSYPVKVAQNYIEYPSSQNESSLYNEIQDAISDAEAAITTANQAAQAANDAAEAVAEAVSGVIDDNQSSNLTTYSSEKIDEDFLKKAGDTATGNITIHKNDPYLLLKNAQGGDQELGLHYYGTVAGENLFGIYDVTGQTHLMTISQETKEVKFYGTLQAIAENNYGKVCAGDKIYMSTDAEGGNLRITPPNRNGNFWEVDAYNGNLRFYHYDVTQGKSTAQFNWGAGGTVSAPFVLNALTATAAGYVLDARQGKVLNDKITALQTTSMGNGTKANSNILSKGFNCHYTKIGRLVQLSIEFDTGTNTISNQKQKLATGVPIPAYPEQSLGIMHCAYANYSPVSINVTSDGVYTWYCGDLVANASYRGFVVYIANR